MKYQTIVNIEKNGAKADGREANTFEVTLMDELKYIDQEQLNFRVSSPAYFSNDQKSIFLKTHVRGERKVEVFSKAAGKIDVKIYRTESAALLNTVVMYFTSSLEEKNLLTPVVEAPRGNSISILKNDVYHKIDSLYIKIRKYEGMKEGQTVKLYWEGRSAPYSSDIVTVKSASDFYFKVPRCEFIDSMGHKVKIYYTVNHESLTHMLYSKATFFEIEKQSITLPEPTINNTRTVLDIAYPQMSSPDKIVVSLISGSKSYSSEVMNIKSPTNFHFNIPQKWIDINKGKYVLFNYSMSRNDSRLFFSFYLRVKL